MASNKKGRGGCDAGPSEVVVDVTSQELHIASAAKSQIKNVDADSGCVVADGLRELGLIRPHGREFEAYILINDRLEYIAKATSRSEAMRLIREARDA